MQLKAAGAVIRSHTIMKQKKEKKTDSRQQKSRCLPDSYTEHFLFSNRLIIIVFSLQLHWLLGNFTLMTLSFHKVSAYLQPLTVSSYIFNRRAPEQHRSCHAHMTMNWHISTKNNEVLHIHASPVVSNCLAVLDLESRSYYNHL